MAEEPNGGAVDVPVLLVGAQVLEELAEPLVRAAPAEAPQRRRKDLEQGLGLRWRI